MDPSQTAAEPLKSIPMSEILRRFREESPMPEEPASREAAENQTRARAEIASIFELKESRAFQWYEKEFIDKSYQEAFDKLRDSSTKSDELVAVRLVYILMRGIKVGLIEREIAHRETLDPADEEIKRLREKLSRM